jgi:Zn-dependent peptidase ImmA (M78 family)
MDTKQKGDDLEIPFYEYLLEQKEKEPLVFGIYPASLCKIFRKKRYYCRERLNNIEFDVVIEIWREGATDPHVMIVFECKNYAGHVPETDITDFSDKLSRIARHGAKGVLVVNSGLQSGAKNLAESRKIGIVKFDEFGVGIIAERQNKLAKTNLCIYETIFDKSSRSKQLKFSAFFDGNYFSSIQTFVASICGERESEIVKREIPVPFISDNKLHAAAISLLSDANYINGPVDLENICSILSIELEWSDEELKTDDGFEILGQADFENRKIKIFSHQNPNRERFTIAHEIGHFHLKHNCFLRSESIVASDLLIDILTPNEHVLNRLELQANIFASYLLLPLSAFYLTIEQLRADYGIRNKGHGYIYVDNQPCNLSDYNRFLGEVSRVFEVSRTVVEIRLKKLDLLKDDRSDYGASIADFL